MSVPDLKDRIRLMVPIDPRCAKLVPLILAACHRLPAEEREGYQAHVAKILASLPDQALFHMGKAYLRPALIDEKPRWAKAETFKLTAAGRDFADRMAAEYMVLMKAERAAIRDTIMEVAPAPVILGLDGAPLQRHVEPPAATPGAPLVNVGMPGRS